MQWWDKFLLLIWKNWKLQLRKPIAFIVEIAVPLLVIAAFQLIRYYVEKDHIPKTIYNPLSIDELPTEAFIGAYSPNTNAFLNKLMQKYPTITGKANAAELEDYLEDPKVCEEYERCIGIQFEDNLPDTPKNFTINLRYGGLTEWHTESLYENFQVRYGSRSAGNDEGGPPDYHGSYFDMMMYHLTKEIVLAYNGNLELMYVNRFPDLPHMKDGTVETLGQSFLFGFLIMTAFTYACISMTKAITLEKEKQLKESMKIMGLPTWLHWTAWFVQMFIPLFIIAILLTLGMKLGLRYGDVLTYSDWSLLLLFFLLYVIGLITFSFALSVFFSKANRAASLAGIIWILTIVPYIIIRSGSYTDIGAAMKYFSSLCLTSGMAYGFDIISLYETIEAGIQWSNLFETSITMNISFGGILLMMLFDIFFYLGIALYVEQIFPGEYGVPQKWYFLFTLEFWSGKKHSMENGYNAPISGEYLEEEPTNLKVGIKIKNLGKTFGANDAVKGLSLNLYEDQITVLLGHNGAGKTTTMSMLTGMFPPTKGTAIINGYDITTQIMDVRDSMGLCPQHNVLFDDLTVKEHLQYFSKLKGCTNDEVDNEVEKFLKLLSLEDKADHKTTALSGGMKRKLCVGIALCGNSKVIMLDEPTAGMDPSARRFIWEFLQKMKKGRTILLTTHFMDEADLLGDRIAIMSGGELKCCGSSFFLKKKYGTGYHLIIEQLPHCQPRNITQMLHKYIPNIQIESNAGTELTYLLPENYAHKFPILLEEIENSSESLGIRSFGISLSDLEEVFMKVGTNETGRNILKEDNTTVDGYTNVTIQSTTLETGTRLHMNQIYAIGLKKMLSTMRSWVMEILKTLLPIIYLLLMILAGRTGSSIHNQLSRRFDLEDYNDPITLVETSDSAMYNNYIKMLENHHQKYEKTTDISQAILKVTKDDPFAAKFKYVVGASFDPVPTAWFNNEPYHTLPLSLQLLLNVYAEQSGIQVDFVNFPLPKKDSASEQATHAMMLSTTSVIGLAVAVVYIGNFYILFNIRERISQAKHLQFVSGINVFIFWFVSFVADLVTFLVPFIAIIITFAIMQPKGLSTASDISFLALLLFDFGVAIIPFMYVCSYFFTVPSTGYSRMFFVGFVAGFPASSIVQVLTLLDWPYAGFTKWLLRLLPHYDFVEGITNVINRYSCDQFFNTCGEGVSREECKKELCDRIPGYSCCTSNGIFSFNDSGISIGIILSYVIAIASFTILFLTDLKILKKLRYKLFSSKIQPMQPPIIDEDVQNENQKIHNTPLFQLQNQNVVVLKDLTKNFKQFIAVNGLNLTVKKSECFGLLGVNGAGKTTTFRMMTGDEMVSFGDGWINGYSIRDQMKQVQRFIGYCPQFDALLDNLTARETLKIFSLIRGVPKYDCDTNAERLAHDFDFTEHLDKEVRELSGGTKRKLSTAIALIGDAPIIFLDEPTTGMDPGTKRHLWNQLSKIRERGKSIILTSHSMEECEALCTRLAIMVNGNFQCIGSTQHLKSRFADGFFVTLKIRKPENSSGLVHADTTAIEQFMGRHFPDSTLKEKHQELLSYYIRDVWAKWSKIFAIMQKAKEELNIEDYSVGQASLEQVFLTFTRNQLILGLPKQRTRYCGIPCCC